MKRCLPNGICSDRHFITHVFGYVGGMDLGNSRLKGGERMNDGLILMYVKDNEIYPVAMTEEQIKLLQYIGYMFEPIKVINQLQGKAVNLLDEKKKS
jgi:hypothetical protein